MTDGGILVAAVVVGVAFLFGAFMVAVAIRGAFPMDIKVGVPDVNVNLRRAPTAEEEE